MRNHVDSYNITDNQTAIVRFQYRVAASLIQMGLEPNVQMTVRDRNRICLQSDLLGAVSFGVRNFLCLQGDHGKFGNEPAAKNVFDLDSMQLIQAVKNMRDEGVFIGGEKLEHPLPRIFIGAVANPFADPFEYRPLRLAKKIAAGAQFIKHSAFLTWTALKNGWRRSENWGCIKRHILWAGLLRSNQLVPPVTCKKMYPA